MNNEGLRSESPKKTANWTHDLENFFFRFADKLIPPRWFLSSVPAEENITAYEGRLNLEVVSHCWNYSHLMAYNLSSYVNHPPKEIDVTVTVFYCPDDTATERLLEFFSGYSIPGVTWNWQPISREMLFRRSIGRNMAALSTKADWIWYIDCDLIFHEGCLDALGVKLQGRKDALLYPDSEFITSLLEDENPLLKSGSPAVIDIDTSIFHKNSIERAIGAYQITHGDIARACGYCNNVRVYQTPTDRWRKTYEDRIYRWLLRTQGKPIEVPNIYRIRHVSKGRYGKESFLTKIRKFSRKTQSSMKEDDKWKM